MIGNSFTVLVLELVLILGGFFFSCNSGAQVVFRSFLHPVFAKRFNSGVPTSSANLRAKADAADKTL